MIRPRYWKTLGALSALLVPAAAGAQTGARPPVMSGASSVPRPSSLPQIRMGSLPQSLGSPSVGDGSLTGGGRWFSPWFWPSWPRHGFGTHFWSETIVPYHVPVPIYVPAPMSVWVRADLSAAEYPPTTVDPTKSKMLTIGTGADGGAGVMRIERLEGGTLRLTWFGSSRPVREARLFIADSAQRALRSVFVDAVTRSALFRIADIEDSIAYTGLTIIFIDGSTQTTLVPYRREQPQQP
ncbi:MAG: hypothetical protein ACT4R6_10595 [Gemmatimonadaceae bacterium]